MPTAPQEPGRLNVSFVRGDAWGQLVDFSSPANVTGYTFAAGLYSTVTGDLVQAITATVVDAVTGQVNLSLTAVQTAAIPAGTYEFRMSCGVWKKTTPHIRVGGVWKQATPKIRAGGAWK